MRLLVLREFVDQFIMHGMNNVKVITAQQAINIHHYKNTKKKSLETNAAVWLNKIRGFTTSNIIIN